MRYCKPPRAIIVSIEACLGMMWLSFRDPKFALSFEIPYPISLWLSRCGRVDWNSIKFDVIRFYSWSSFLWGPLWAPDYYTDRPKPCTPPLVKSFNLGLPSTYLMKDSIVYSPTQYILVQFLLCYYVHPQNLSKICVFLCSFSIEENNMQVEINISSLFFFRWHDNHHPSILWGYLVKWYHKIIIMRWYFVT